MMRLPPIPPLAALSAWIRKGVADKKGVAAVELALASPLLLVLFCGTVEMTRFISTHYQAAQMATTVTDVVARYKDVTSDHIQTIFDVSERVMGETDFQDIGLVILSSVAKERATDDPVVVWQCHGGGQLPESSALGGVNQRAVLPAGMTLVEEKDNVIVAEVYYRYSPIFSLIPMIGDTTVYKTAVFRPRLGALTAAPGC